MALFVTPFAPVSQCLGVAVAAPMLVWAPVHRRTAPVSRTPTRPTDRFSRGVGAPTAALRAPPTRKPPVDRPRAPWGKKGTRKGTSTDEGVSPPPTGPYRAAPPTRCAVVDRRSEVGPPTTPPDRVEAASTDAGFARAHRCSPWTSRPASQVPRFASPFASPIPLRSQLRCRRHAPACCSAAFALRSQCAPAAANTTRRPTPSKVRKCAGVDRCEPGGAAGGHHIR